MTSSNYRRCGGPVGILIFVNFLLHKYKSPTKSPTRATSFRQKTIEYSVHIRIHIWKKNIYTTKTKYYLCQIFVLLYKIQKRIWINCKLFLIVTRSLTQWPSCLQNWCQKLNWFPHRMRSNYVEHLQKHRLTDKYSVQLYLEW